MQIIPVKMLLIFFIICVSPVPGFSAESGWNEAGVRAGIPAKPRSVYVRQYEAFAVYRLPWDWRNSSGWGLTPHMNYSLGALNGGGETGFIGSAGPSIVLNKRGPGFTADLGINANILDRRDFAGLDLGSILLFGAHVGINYQLTNGVKIGYRLEHMSNGHILYPNGTPNPGLDTQFIAISCVF